LIALLVLIAAIATIAYAATIAILAGIETARDEAARGRAIALMAMFAPALDAVERDPRALLVWEPLARSARTLSPDDMAAVDRAFGAAFPFSADAVQRAHARWTADWLAWEQTHDAEYKLKAKEAESDRAKLDHVEREKLDRYQRRYEEYVRVSKGLQALFAPPRS
jgi:hypothetical protein